jgi:hypothetical protein
MPNKIKTSENNQEEPNNTRFRLEANIEGTSVTQHTTCLYVFCKPDTKIHHWLNYVLSFVLYQLPRDSRHMYYTITQWIVLPLSVVCCASSVQSLPADTESTELERSNLWWCQNISLWVRKFLSTKKWDYKRGTLLSNGNSFLDHVIENFYWVWSIETRRKIGHRQKHMKVYIKLRFTYLIFNLWTKI